MPTEITANERFVAQHLAHRWLDLARLPSWPGHQGALLAAARARGLETVPTGKAWLFFRAGRCVGGFSGTRSTSLTGELARELAQDKEHTRSLLAALGVPVPDGRCFAVDDLPQATRHLTGRGGGRVVVKPVDAAGGRGISTEVTTPGQLAAAWQRAAAQTRVGRLVVEEQVPGVDVRVYVVGGSPVAAAVRVPPHVVGDGTATLRELTERLRAARAGHAYLCRSLRPDPTYLEHTGVGWSTVLAPGRIQLLNGTGNVSGGGVNVDVTDDLHPDLLALAAAVARGVPGLGAGGVDLLVPDTGSAAGAVVIEVNAGANLSVNQYPGFGRPRDVAGAVVAEMLHQAGTVHARPARARPARAGVAVAP